MSSFNAIFQIIENKKCPLYKLDDILRLTDKALFPPDNKPVCLILAREMTELLFSLLSQKFDDTSKDLIFSCSGCSGLIKFKMNQSDAVSEDEASLSISEIFGKRINVPPKAAEGIDKLPLFQAMERKNLATILSYFTYRQLEPGVEIFRKGEKGDDVIIILSGRVAVLDGNLNIATLSRGEILGEMSQLTSQAVSATVKTVEKTEVLSISGENFRKVLEENPSLYLYFLRLFSERLTKSNAARLQEVASAMSGTLDEMPQVELFQVFHMNNKTGVLTLELPKGEATIAFREGGIIYASYAREKNQDAIYDIIAENKGGRFKFIAGLSVQDMQTDEIGDFMKLLMDGLRKVDENNSPAETEEDDSL